MVIQVQHRKNGGIGLIIFFIILLFGGWFFFKIIKTEYTQPKLEEILPPSSQEIISAQLDINKILNNPVFLSLASHISWPLSLPQLGKTNPFLPF